MFARVPDKLVHNTVQSLFRGTYSYVTVCRCVGVWGVVEELCRWGGGSHVAGSVIGSVTGSVQALGCDTLHIFQYLHVIYTDTVHMRLILFLLQMAPLRRKCQRQSESSSSAFDFYELQLQVQGFTALDASLVGSKLRP